MRDTTGTVWVCTDCMMVLANGDDSGLSEGAPEPLNRLGGQDLTPGMDWSEHECGRPASGADECECETRAFDWRDCEGCGGLAGERHAVTVWTRETVARGHWSACPVDCDSPNCRTV